MDFNKTYRNSPDSLKMKYLDAIIQNNNQLSNEFLAFHAGNKSDAVHLVNMTYNHKPKLPALKDEMRKMGLR
jgi:hypothetical protein